MASEVLSVSELNCFIKDVLSAGIPRALWICGEIQGYDRNKGRQHLFFELVEKDPLTQETKARASVAIWAGVRQKIDAVLKRAENSFELKDDIEVKLLCKVDFYPPHGAVRLIVENIDPVHTLGKISQDRQKLIADLSAQGVLARNKALTLPVVCLRVGLITAFDSAAYNDFISELRNSGFSFVVFMARAVMQGKGCEPSVCAAVRMLNQRTDIDVIVITRGGGSIAELSCFDSKAIALAVAESRYPVLSGIGHEINTTVTDLAANTFVKTPTAAAQFLVNQVAGFRNVQDEQLADLCRLARERLRSGRERIRQDAFKLQTRCAVFFQAVRNTHIRKQEICRSLSRAVILRSREKLLREQEFLNRTIHLRLADSRTKIASIERLVELSSPVKLLRRGFSITRGDDGKVVRSVSAVRKLECITTQLADGNIVSAVQNVTREVERGGHEVFQGHAQA